MKKIFLTLITVLTAITASAQETTSHIDVRLGYSLGGTMPVGMPATIRSLNKYSLQPNLQVGADYEYLFNSKLGITAGLRFENKGMKTDAQVKNYHMKMVQGEDIIEGNFTGNVVTKTTMWQFAIPVQASFYAHKNVRIKAGPYITIALDKEFGGYAYDGYLRKGTPVGPRVELGSTPSERGNYDFNDDLRSINWGFDIGADWFIHKNFGIYADLTWGMNGAFKSSFTTIEQTMHPIYGTIGICYRIK